jgi:hypothetical protein
MNDKINTKEKLAADLIIQEYISLKAEIRGYGYRDWLSR